MNSKNQSKPRDAECHPCVVWDRTWNSLTMLGKGEESEELQGPVAAWKGKVLGRGDRKQERRILFC